MSVYPSSVLRRGSHRQEDYYYRLRDVEVVRFTESHLGAVELKTGARSIHTRKKNSVITCWHCFQLKIFRRKKSQRIQVNRFGGETWQQKRNRLESKGTERALAWKEPANKRNFFGWTKGGPTNWMDFEVPKFRVHQFEMNGAHRKNWLLWDGKDFGFSTLLRSLLRWNWVCEFVYRISQLESSTHYCVLNVFTS